MKYGLKPDNFYNNVGKNDYDYSDVEILFESNNDINVSQVVNFKGESYSICIINRERGISLIKKINIDLTSDSNYSEDVLECPCCGWKNQDSWELKDDDDNYECGSCGAVLAYTTEMTRSFHVDVIEKPEIIEIKEFKNV